MADYSTMAPFMPEVSSEPQTPEAAAEVERQLRLLQALSTLNASEAYRRGDSLPKYLGDTAAGAAGGLTTIPQMLGDAAGWGINKLNLAPNTTTERAPFEPIQELEALKDRNPVAAMGGTLMSPGLGPVLSGVGQAAKAVGSLPAAGKVALGGAAGVGVAPFLADPSEAQTRRGQARQQQTSVPFSPEVQAIQRELASKGIPVGEVDGLMGPKTAEAIRMFQRAYGLEPTGIIDAPTAKAVRKLDPNYVPTPEEKLEMSEREAAAAKTKSEADRATQETQSKGQWDQLLQRMLPYGVGAGVGVVGATGLAALQRRIGLGRVGDFNKLADRIGQRHDAAPAGNLIGTKVGDDMVADVNAAYQAAGSKAPFTPDRMARTIEGTPEAVAASAGQRYGGYASKEGMEAAIGHDLRRQSPFVDAGATGGKAAGREAAELAGTIDKQRRGATEVGDEFFKKNPASLGPIGDNLLPIAGAVDYGAAKLGSHMSDDPATKEAMDKLASLGIGIATAGGAAQKILGTGAKASAKAAMSKTAEPTVASARARMERDLGSYVPGGTKAAVTVRKPVGDQTPAERAAVLEMARQARAANREAITRLRSDPDMASFHAASKTLGPDQYRRALNEKYGVELSRKDAAVLKRSIDKDSVAKGLADAKVQLAQVRQGATGEAAIIWSDLAKGGDKAKRALLAIAPQLKQGIPGLAHLPDEQVAKLITKTAKGGP
jgi:peptidoglycan hydrolase-like protein with peptidoglycan-binding domain